jgi:hypothetical protein
MARWASLGYKKGETGMKTEDLVQFLLKAKRDGYASGDTTTKEENDGSYSTRLAEGDFRFHDNWFGGEPFAGREVVWYKGKPTWMMVYFGEEKVNAGSNPILRKALSKMPNQFPARGPKSLEDGDYKYENNWNGGINKFSGEEAIYLNGEKVYSAWYSGGLVDQEKAS